MVIKKKNHILPRMVIKRWEKCNGKIFEKELNRVRKIQKKDFSVEYYYSLGKEDDELENRISKFECYIASVLKKINDSEQEVVLNVKEIEILKLYAVLQSCRNHNTSPVIKEDESGIYLNNNYLFGVCLVETQEDAVNITKKICDEFDKIIKLNDNDVYESSLCYGMHLVLAYNNSNAFLISETTAIIECSMDSDYMFTYIPISPNISLILAKTKYFYDYASIENTKIRFGNKYGNGIPDPYLSNVLDDYKLIYNGKKMTDGKVCIKYINLSKNEINCLNSIIYEDGQKILYSSEQYLESAKRKCNIRIVNCN